MEILSQLFPGISTFFAMEPAVAIARVALIVLGFFLAYYGFKRTLEPLIMVPMGIAMMAVNAGMMFLSSGAIGNMFVDPLPPMPWSWSTSCRSISSSPSITSRFPTA